MNERSNRDYSYVKIKDTCGDCAAAVWASKNKGTCGGVSISRDDPVCPLYRRIFMALVDIGSLAEGKNDSEFSAILECETLLTMALKRKKCSAPTAKKNLTRVKK